MDQQRQRREPTLTNDNATGLGTKLDNGFGRRRYTSASPAYFAPPSKITSPSIRSHPCFSHANSGPTKPGGELDTKRVYAPARTRTRPRKLTQRYQ